MHQRGLRSLPVITLAVAVAAGMLLGSSVVSAARQADTPPTLVWVAADDDGSPVFLYNSPHEGDRSSVLATATPLSVLGDEVEGDGQRWYIVRTPDDDEGYVMVPATTIAKPDETPP